MSKPLYIPKTKKLKGLKVYCYECKATVDAVCKQSGANIAACKHGADHVFKAFAHVPGSSKGRKTRALDTRDLDEARRQTLAFQKEVKQRHTDAPRAPVEFAGAHPVVVPTQRPETAPEQQRSTNLLVLMAQYIGYLHNEGVPEHQHKQRSPDHIAQVERMFKYFALAMQKNGYPFKALRADEISEEMIGKYHRYLLDTKHFGNRSYNRAFSIFTSFYAYLNTKKYTIVNPFVVTRKPVGENVQTIEDPDDFEKLLAIVQKPELGIRILQSGKYKGKRKNLYKPWMKDAIELGAYTGRRREEIARMKWNQIEYDKDLHPLYISVEDLKVNRQKGNSKETLKYNYVPVTDELHDLLIRLGEAQYRHSDNYIIAPDERMQRDTIKSFMSRSFSHYYAQLFPDRPEPLTFGSLRRTNFTQLSSAIGLENAQAISGHGSVEVMKKHYVRKQVIAKAAKDFAVYKKAKQIEAVRNEKETPENDLGISR